MNDATETTVEDPIAAMPTETGVQRAAKRLAIKRLANEGIPIIDREETRQARRARVRRAEKDLRKHRNENISKRNVRQRTRYPFLNRAEYRKLVSNRAPMAWKLQVIQYETERLANAA